MTSTILYELIHDGDYFREVFPILKTKHFDKIEHSLMFKSIRNYYNEYKEIPSLRELVIEIKNLKEYKKNPEIRKSLVREIKNVFQNENQEKINKKFLTQKTEEYIKNKEFMEFLVESADKLQKDNLDLPSALSKVTDIIQISIEKGQGIDFSEIQKRIEYYKKKIKGVKTNLPTLDKLLGGGFMPKTLNIIAAKSGIGKSLFGSSLTAGMAISKKNILVVTLEMSDFEYMKRVDANILDLNINDFRHLEEQVILKRFNDIKDHVGRIKSIEFPSGKLSPLGLEKVLDDLKVQENFTPDIVIIDYLALMKSDRYSTIQNSNSYYTSIAEDVRAIAQQRNIPILSFSQLQRGQNDSFSQDNVSLAKGIYETADTFFFLVSNPEMKERGEIILTPDKNRNTGITHKTILLNIDYQKMRVTDEGEGERTDTEIPNDVEIDTDITDAAMNGLDFSTLKF